MHNHKYISVAVGVVIIIAAVSAAVPRKAPANGTARNGAAPYAQSAGSLQVKAYAPQVTDNVPAQQPTDPQPTSSPSYTLAQIAPHNNTSSCWTAVNGNVYDLTAWINAHPGGDQAIMSMCGIDASDAFNQQHGGQRKPERELASFLIGALTK